MNSIVLFLLLCSCQLIAQDEIEFGLFEGLVYDIPSKELEMGHGKHVYDNRILDSIKLKRLEIAFTNDNIPFPFVSQLDKFGLVLFSKLHVKEDGCYEFYLASDDGSKLWIDGTLITNNDRPHKKTIKRDSISLISGFYEAKVWYYNAYRDQYGIILQARKIDKDLCRKTLTKKNRDTIVLGVDLLFPFDKDQLQNDAKPQLDSLCSYLEDANASSITIIGHSDSVGSDDYNFQLALQRALEISQYITRSLSKQKLEIKVLSYGESKPLNDNSTAAYRAQNRRVEIVINN